MKTSSTDPIADMLVRLTNALAVNQTTVKIPFSTTKAKILKLLAEAGFINSVEVPKTNLAELIVNLEAATRPIIGVKRISKPGRRVYVTAKARTILGNGQGITIVSTSQGLVPGYVAKSRSLGGEMICEVW